MTQPELSPPDGTFDLEFPYSLGKSVHRAGFRTIAEEFRVVEDLGFEPSGQGEHLLLRIRKREQNTRWLAANIASHFGIAEHAVGYCGMKDRNAVTTQWFSVHLPGLESPTLPSLEGCDIVATTRHSRKLRPGMHRANHFSIVLRYEADAIEDVNRRLACIAEDGVPNYFGLQRFGINGNNLREVAAIVASKRPRFRGKRGGLYLSAARSWIFNQVLAERVKADEWRDPVLDGPLWGRGRPAVAAELAAGEAAILNPWKEWCQVLEHSGLSQERRRLALKPEGFDWEWDHAALQLSFTLPPGCYATAVLRELATLVEPDRHTLPGLTR